MRRSALLLAVVIVVSGGYLVGTLHNPSPAAAQATDSAQQGILVSGLGKVNGTPDVLRVDLGVEVRRVDVSSSIREANLDVDRVRQVVRADGVDSKDMQTQGVSLYPTYTNNGVPNGYDVTEGLTLKVRNLARAGKVIADAVEAGGSAARLQGVTFALEDNAALLDQARDAAYADAQQKAQRYATLSGRSLGAFQLVSELPMTSNAPALHPATGSAGSAALAAAVPVEPGQAQVSVSVTVRWALR